MNTPSILTSADIQAIADLTAKYIGLSFRPKAVIKDIRRGFAHTDNGWFSVPKWAFKRGDQYVTYYTIHETCHFYGGGIVHGNVFRKVEDKALSYWGIYLERKKVYPKRIFAGPCKTDSFVTT